jgi:hypothetical protein
MIPSCNISRPNPGFFDVGSGFGLGQASKFSVASGENYFSHAFAGEIDVIEVIEDGIGQRWTCGDFV